MNDQNYQILVTEGEKEYELLDSGNGEKLERYGTITVSRPDPQAIGNKQLPESEWKKAEAQFVREEKENKGAWKYTKAIPKKWPITFAGLTFEIRTSSFKHTGLFPEQKSNWQWISKIITGTSKPKILNLFGYTGGATLAASKAGAEVVHVDGSKVALTWAKENAKLSGLEHNSIRWILDDALIFVKREIKRGNTYDGIIMDPPAFGRGPEGEVWKIEDNLLELLTLSQKLLSPNPLFFLINGYASGYSALAYADTLAMLVANWKGTVEAGEVAIKETGSNRLLPCGIFARAKK
jgi:23S rRNA (cytosine1962-C5)-methyltransferase